MSSLYGTIKEAKRVLDKRYLGRFHHHGGCGWFFTGKDDGDRRFYSGIGCIFNGVFYPPLPKKLYVDLKSKQNESKTK